MQSSEIKTASFTSGGYFKVSVLKISARLDKVKEGLYWAQLGALHEEPILRKTQKQVSELFSIQINIESLFGSILCDFV